ncbi:MAG: phosphate ABC transporter permease PstA, partial [Pseudomonadota bacterium]
IKLDLHISQEIIDPTNSGDPKIIGAAAYNRIINAALLQYFPDVTSRNDKRMLYQFISTISYNKLKQFILDNPELIGQNIAFNLKLRSKIDMYLKGNFDKNLDERFRAIKDKEISWINKLAAQDLIHREFNKSFFTNADSRNPEMAGIWGSMIGSFFTIICCMIFAFPVGVMTAIYLERFAPKNKLTDIIELNINNLAAVPSIVFGLLGLSIYLGLFGMPRSSSLVGGLTLALLVLPTIVITARNAIKAVPPSITEGALALGASPLQVVVHHILPLAVPGIMTGTILSVARALGETAPLLMIGMVAFIADAPSNIFDPATAMPVQIYLWSDSPELGFVERTSAAIMILLSILLLMNSLAVYLRKKFEIKW